MNKIVHCKYDKCLIILLLFLCLMIIVNAHMINGPNNCTLFDDHCGCSTNSYIYMIIDHIAFTIVLDITIANLFGINIRMPTIFFKCWKFRVRDLKNSGKYGSGLSCRWTLFTAWAFGSKLHLIFHRVELNKPWPNLKNLSGGLNLSHGLNMVGST